MRYLRFPEGKDRAVTLSYDDGCRSDIRFSREIGRYGLRATFNLNSGLIAEQPGEWRLTEEEIREYLLRPGYEIAVHGEYHRSTGALRPLEGIREVLGCRLSLEQRFGGLVRGMAYPNAGITQLSEGVTYPEIRQYLRELGIVYARTLGGDNDRFELPNDLIRKIRGCLTGYGHSGRAERSPGRRACSFCGDIRLSLRKTAAGRGSTASASSSGAVRIPGMPPTWKFTPM